MTLLRAWQARTVEATPGQIVATGSAGGAYGRDPIDGDIGWKPAGSHGRPVPAWTLERARTHAIAAYRSNPMAKAVIDTYTSFCVGDSGVKTLVTNPQVAAVVDEFWTDPRNRIADIQDLWLRDQLLTGETLLELMQGPTSGVVRFSPIDPIQVAAVEDYAGNPLWPDVVHIREGQTGSTRGLKVAAVDDATGLRDGGAMWWTPFKALMTDQRSMPFISAILDWLDSYDMILSNLIDRTALARYLVWDVSVAGGQAGVDAYVAARGGLHVPPSGSIEVHSDDVKWEPRTAQTGAFEDTAAAGAVLTSVAAGAGIGKHWLAEPEHTNRATGQTMAEPIRRRVAGVQRQWLGYQTELVRFAVDRAVAAGRLPRMVDATDPRTGNAVQIRAAQAVTVTGPEIAAADSQITAQVLLNLSTGLANLVEVGALSQEGASIAARKAWEDFVGVPYTADLDKPTTNIDDLATAVAAAPKLAAVATSKAGA